MKTSTKINASITVILVFLSLFLSAQNKVQKSVKGQNKSNVATQNSVSRQQLPSNATEGVTEPGLLWSENFGSSENKITGDKGNSAETFGWTKTNLYVGTASKPNQWFVSGTAPGNKELGECSKVWPLTETTSLTNQSLDNRTLHIGKFNSNLDGDEGAFFQTTDENITDVRIESPLINCSGVSDLEISFHYYTGGNALTDFLELYCYDGLEWTLVTTFLPSEPGDCAVSIQNNSGLDLDNQGLITKWVGIGGILLPQSASNNPSVKIGFRWKNTGNPSATNKSAISVAIDNIKIYNKGVVNNSNLNSSTERVSGSMITKNILVNATIENNKPVLTITAKNENTSGKYIIERSKDGATYEKVSEINSTYNSKKMQQNNYSYTDLNAPEGMNYYRVVKELGTNRKLTSQSVVAEVSTERKINFTIYPNPNNGQFIVDFGGIENNFNIELILMDQYGKKVYNTEFELKSISDNKFSFIPENLLKNGRYYCTLIIEGIKYTSTVIVQ